METFQAWCNIAYSTPSLDGLPQPSSMIPMHLYRWQRIEHICCIFLACLPCIKWISAVLCRAQQPVWRLLPITITEDSACRWMPGKDYRFLLEEHVPMFRWYMFHKPKSSISIWYKVLPLENTLLQHKFGYNWSLDPNYFHWKSYSIIPQTFKYFIRWGDIWDSLTFSPLYP